MPVPGVLPNVAARSAAACQCRRDLALVVRATACLSPLPLTIISTHHQMLRKEGLSSLGCSCPGSHIFRPCTRRACIFSTCAEPFLSRRVFVLVPAPCSKRTICRDARPARPRWRVRSVMESWGAEHQCAQCASRKTLLASFIACQRH